MDLSFVNCFYCLPCKIKIVLLSYCLTHDIVDRLFYFTAIHDYRQLVFILAYVTLQWYFQNILNTDTKGNIREDIHKVMLQDIKERVDMLHLYLATTRIYVYIRAHIKI